MVMVNRTVSARHWGWGWMKALPLIFILFAVSQIWLTSQLPNQSSALFKPVVEPFVEPVIKPAAKPAISSLDDGNAANSLNRVNITALHYYQPTLITNKYNQSPIIYGLSPGTTGTHTHFEAACSLGLPSVHHFSFCACPTNGMLGVSQNIIDGLQAHDHILKLNELAYKCTMGAQAKDASSRYYKLKNAKLCKMDIREWATQTQGNITNLLTSGIVGIFDYPYPNMIDFILNTIPKVRGETFQSTLLYTKRETRQWTISRIKHGFLLCKEDYDNIESKLNNTREVQSANSYHGKVPLYLSEFNIFECIDRAVSKSKPKHNHMTLSDVFWYETNKKKTEAGKPIKQFIKRKNPGLFKALQSSYEWHQEHYSVMAHYLPDFFGVDSPKVADGDNSTHSKSERIGSKEVARNIFLVLESQGFLHRGGNKHALPLISSSLEKLKFTHN